MSQKILLPIEFRFEVPRVFWQRAVVRLVGWQAGVTNAPVVEIVEPTEHAGARLTMTIESMPTDIAAEVKQLSRIYPVFPEGLLGGPTRLSDEIERVFGTRSLDALLSSVPPSRRLWRALFGSDDHPVDPWVLRDEFLHLRPTSDLIEFLNHWGKWGQEDYNHPIGSLSRDNADLHVMFPEAIWLDQRRIRSAMISRHDEWLLKADVLSRFESSGAGPCFSVVARTCYSAIELTITLDFLRDFEFRACARKDCRLPFRVESKHKRKYCNPACAHLAAVRRGRKKAAKPRESARKES